MRDSIAQTTGLGAGYGNALIRAHERIAELEAEVARLRTGIAHKDAALLKEIGDD